MYEQQGQSSRQFISVRTVCHLKEQLQFMPKRKTWFGVQQRMGCNCTALFKPLSLSAVPQVQCLCRIRRWHQTHVNCSPATMPGLKMPHIQVWAAWDDPQSAVGMRDYFVGQCMRGFYVGSRVSMRTLYCSHDHCCGCLKDLYTVAQAFKFCTVCLSYSKSEYEWNQATIYHCCCIGQAEVMTLTSSPGLGDCIIFIQKYFRFCLNHVSFIICEMEKSSDYPFMWRAKPKSNDYY